VLGDDIFTAVVRERDMAVAAILMQAEKLCKDIPV